MKQFELASEINSFVQQQKLIGNKVGFVPTMGALHQGHMSLIKKAQASCDVVVVSIFVNPTQFNESKDFDKYPRTIKEDLFLLKKQQVSAVFTPTTTEMYPENHPSETFSFNGLDEVMEGKFRQGHFNGVAMVVKRLFEIVTPDLSFFGEKDYQQLAIIRKLVNQANLQVQIIGCPTLREPNGLAMSSRNERLSSEARSKAKIIYECLTAAKSSTPAYSVEETKAKAIQTLESNPNMSVEYVEIANCETLQPIENWKEASSVGMFVAVRLEDVRLIDNIILI